MVESIWSTNRRAEALNLRAPTFASAYQQWLVEPRKQRLRFLMRFVLLVVGLFLFRDLALFGWGQTFLTVALLRAAIAGYTLWTLSQLRRVSGDRAPGQLDQIDLTWGIAVAAFILAQNFSHQSIAHVGFDAVFVLLVYLSSRPAKIKHTLVAIFCVANVISAVARELPLADIATLACVYITTSVVGHSVSKTLNVLLRQRFAETFAARASDDPEVVAMCAYCDRIRFPDEGREWLRPVEYLATQLSQDVTHGICPGCAARAGFESANRPEPSATARREDG